MARYLGLRGKKLDSALIWAVILPSYLLFGYNNACGGGLLSMPNFYQTFPQINTATTKGHTNVVNSRVQGTVVAIYTLGCFFGALNCILVGDRLGRRRTIFLGALGNLLGAIIQSTSYSLPQLIVGRIVSGIGFGHLTATAPNWQAECSRAEHRGATVLLESIFISAGLSIAAWVTFGMSYVDGGASWRFPLGFSGFFSILVMIGIIFMPDSPRWLIKHGRIDEAKNVLSALADAEPDSEDVSESVAEISQSLAIAGEAKFINILGNGDLRLFHRVALAACGQLFQQMSGINVVGFYSSSVFHEDLGLSAVRARILSAGVFMWQTLCSPIGVLTVDRFGRRKLMIFAAIGMGCCMVVIGAGSAHPNNKAAVGVAAAAIFLFSLFFPTGFLGLTFLYAAEIAPLSYRVPITSISTGTAWLFNFLVAEITPVAFSTIGWRYFFVYAAMNLGMVLPAVYFFFPETNGRHLEEVDEIFIRSKSIFDTVSVAKNMPVGLGIQALHDDKTADGMAAATTQIENGQNGDRQAPEEANGSTAVQEEK